MVNKEDAYEEKLEASITCLYRGTKNNYEPFYRW